MAKLNGKGKVNSVNQQVLIFLEYPKMYCKATVQW